MDNVLEDMINLEMAKKHQINPIEKMAFLFNEIDQDDVTDKRKFEYGVYNTIQKGKETLDKSDEKVYRI